ncbi:MAG: dockerin type I repeat-containing protein [Oscillospiraceae bacterium]|nr:dockerin type I repeat-containing protein [Oscillospiraceae bacterium]
MKKLLTLLVTFAFICALALPAFASLPNVDLGREIKLAEDDSGTGNIVKKAGLTLTRSQFETIGEDLSDEGMDIEDFTLNNFTRFVFLYVDQSGKTIPFTDYEKEIRDTANQANREDYERFIQEFNAWANPRKALVDFEKVSAYKFDIMDLLVETEDDKVFLKNMHGATMNLLLEIPADMRGSYDYYVFGATYSYNMERYIFNAANNGNVLTAANNYITVSLRGFGEFVLVAIPNNESQTPVQPEPEPEAPKAQPQTFTTADALNVLRYVAGTATLTSEQRAQYDLNGDGSIDTADALAILRQVAGMG